MVKRGFEGAKQFKVKKPETKENNSGFKKKSWNHYLFSGLSSYVIHPFPSHSSTYPNRPPLIKELKWESHEPWTSLKLWVLVFHHKVVSCSFPRLQVFRRTERKIVDFFPWKTAKLRHVMRPIDQRFLRPLGNFLRAGEDAHMPRFMDLLIRWRALRT